MDHSNPYFAQLPLLEWSGTVLDNGEVILSFSGNEELRFRISEGDAYKLASSIENNLKLKGHPNILGFLEEQAMKDQSQMEAASMTHSKGRREHTQESDNSQDCHSP